MIRDDLRRLFFSGRRSRGVTVFAWILIVSSLVHIRALITGVEWYVNFCSYMPPWLIVLRYAFSWLQRLLGLLAAVGLLALNETARRLAIFIGVFTILTVYWKHPYPAFKLHAASLDQRWGVLLRATGAPESITFSSMAMVSVIVHCLGDIVFCGSLIYFLTRPAVKAQFRRKA